MSDYEYGRLHVAQDINFNGFLVGHMTFDIGASVTNNNSQLDCTVTNAQVSYGKGGGTGWGFANFAGMLWGAPQFSADNLGFCPNRGAPENIDQVISQMRSVSGGEIPDNVLWGVVKTDDAAQTATREITHYSHSFPLTSSSFNADGSLKDIQLVSYGSRWYSNGEQGTVAGRAVVSSGGSYSLHLNQLRSYYYPWSVRSGNDWKSCNRSGGSFSMRQNNAWTGLKNEQNGYGTQHGFYRNNNGWQRLPKFGGQ